MSVRSAIWFVLSIAACGDGGENGTRGADTGAELDGAELDGADADALDESDAVLDGAHGAEDDTTPPDDAPEASPPDADPPDLADDAHDAVPDGALDTAPDLGPSDTGPDAQVFTCTERQAVTPERAFFVEVSRPAGIQVDNYLKDHPIKVPINDHSRLAFVDLDGDGFDDIVAHSLFPNPQSGVPFEHLVFLNDGDGTFTDHSTASGLRDVQAGFFAFGDVDNDGDLDCFAGLDAQGIPGGDHGVFLNDGQAHFTRVPSSGIAVPAVPPAVGNAVFGDFDGDAVLDLYLGVGQTSYAGRDFLFRGNGDGTFSDVSNRLLGNKILASNGSVTCDFDDDGDLDIVVSTYGVSTGKGHNLLWQNDGQGNFVEVAQSKNYAAQSTGNYWLASTGRGRDDEPGATPASYVGDNGFGVDCDDIDNDGYMDIFQTAISHPVDGDYSRKWSDPTQLLINGGPGASFAFENRFLAVGLPFNEGDVDGAAIDFDNDGRLDLSLSRDSKYEAAYADLDQKGWFGLMRQTADGRFASLGIDSGINNLESRYAASLTACSDDGACPDGERCYFAACRTPCTSDAECSDATGESCGHFFSDALGVTQSFCRPLQQGRRAQNHAWSDIDHDGDLDLLIGGRDGGGGRPNFLFRNEIGHLNRWLAIRVFGDGVNVNRDGIGTRLRLVAADARQQTREVQGSRGMYNGMDGMTQHFGLGDFPCSYTLEVRWPDGRTAAFTSGTFPEGRLELRYPDRLTFDATSASAPR